tara:strand:- start:110322 stop:110768 length:447 start_codon:yes stop_codon:yes gene_type:complete
MVLFFCFIAANISAQSNQEAAIKETIAVFFDGLQRGDTLVLKKAISEDLVLQTAFINQQGVSVLRTENSVDFLKSLASKNPSDTWEENLLSYAIQVDGNMAQVWTPYEFYLNKKFSHCGVNSFQLFNDGTVWKIIYIIDTRRKQDCVK